jgi:hypothetical protein
LSGTAAVSETRTDAAGGFVFPAIARGSYSLEVQGRGFLPVVRELTVPAAAPIAVQMQQITTTVEVSAPVGDFLTSTFVSVTKSPVDLMNSPYAVQVIPKALIEERGIQDIKQLFRNIAGAGSRISRLAARIAPGIPQNRTTSAKPTRTPAAHGQDSVAKATPRRVRHRRSSTRMTVAALRSTGRASWGCTIVSPLCLRIAPQGC